MRQPIVHGKKLTWFYITDTGFELNEQFKSWSDVEKRMLIEGVQTLPANFGILALVGFKRLEEQQQSWITPDAPSVH